MSIKKIKIFSVIIAFFSIFSFSLGSASDAANNALDFFVPHFPKEYEIRDLENDYGLSINPNYKSSIVYKDTVYGFYTSPAKTGAEFEIPTRLFQGYEYIIIGAGDQDIYDLDIKIYDENDNVVALDRSTQKYSLPVLNTNYIQDKSINNDFSIANKKISVCPVKTANYKLKILVRNAEIDKGGNWAVIIASKTK